jgi:hypothetical protein
MSDRLDDIEHDDFELLLSEKRHRELVTAVTELGNRVASSTDNTKVINALSGLSQKLEQLATKQKAPVVNVDSDNSDVVGSVDALQASILKGLAEVKAAMQQLQEKKTWVVDVRRGNAGYIDQLTFKQG